MNEENSRVEIEGDEIRQGFGQRQDTSGGMKTIVTV